MELDVAEPTQVVAATWRGPGGDAAKGLDCLTFCKGASSPDMGSGTETRPALRAVTGPIEAAQVLTVERQRDASVREDVAQDEVDLA